MKQLQGKVAAITGAGSGIGQALSIELAKLGCEVALSDKNEAGLRETATQVQATGIKCTTCVLDVADRAAVYAWAVSYWGKAQGYAQRPAQGSQIGVHDE